MGFVFGPHRVIKTETPFFHTNSRNYTWKDLMTEGTFQKVGRSKNRMFGPKAMVFCGFEPAEHEPLAAALMQIGFGDRPLIFATAADSGRTLEEVLSLPDRSGMGTSAAMARATIMSGFSQEEVHVLMSAFRQAGFPRQLWATLTPVSAKWTLAALLEELAAEDAGLRKKDG